MASISGGASASFHYDYAGRRMQKTVSGATTGFLYDGANAVQEQSGTTANLLTGFGYDQFYSRTDGGGTAVPLADSLNSTVGLTDASGGFTSQYTYEPFGATTTSGGTSSAYQYTGRENDGTGLYYYRARYMSPALGRFMSEDPLGFGGGDVNLYAYVGGQVLDFRDPSGLFGYGLTYGGMGAIPATGVTASYSFGWFNDDRNGYNSVATFGSLGAFSNGMDAVRRCLGAADPFNTSSFAIGGALSYGGSIFFTNARDVYD